MADTLTIENLSLTYPGEGRAAVADVSLRVEGGEIVALVGPSGSGKSSLLRLIAGLERPDGGSISLGAECFANGRRFVRPDRRRVGLVAQGSDLFPHLSVARNVGYGLRKAPRRARRARVAELLEQVGLANLSGRYPAALSGGEAQRIALARALAPRPRLLLLDEPFSNLDAELRERLRNLTLDLLRGQRTTALFVTHHGDDALAVGDRVAVLQHGRLVQTGSPRDVWERPANVEVAALFGSVNVLPGSAGDGARPRLARPDQLSLCPEAPDCLASGTVSRIEFLGLSQRVTVHVEHRDLYIRVHAPARMPITLGSRVGVRWIEE